jgi:hypothetical protein
MQRCPTALLLVLLVLAPHAAGAQSSESPDFLFGRPGGMVGFRTGWLFARADSDLYRFVQQHLTVDRKDFNAPAVGMDVEIVITPRFSAIGGFDFSQTSKNSEYRDFVDNQRLPITQSTRLREFNLGGSVKFALLPRGREISSRAWIPSIATPYVGGGAGVMKYEFFQEGDFIDVDTATLDIFTDTFRSSGWTPSAHVFGGVDVRVYRRLYLSAEGRYLWANATLDRDFIRFEPLDLAGFKATAGIHYLF